MGLAKKEKFNFQNKKGFSLPELMIVIAIIGIMSGVALVSLSGSKEKKEVETAAREVEAAIRETQNGALTGKGVGASPGCYFNFFYDKAAGTFGTDGGCMNVTYKLNNGVAFSGSGSFGFSIPFGDTLGGEIKLEKGATCYMVKASPSGRVENYPCP
ncbi:MAG TPA: hypothetical protein DIT25_04360 [Candidatus Moranbacteria bacterium]|nr:hypothetical protein [Candidatus Moranbacteria bacterium]